MRPGRTHPAALLLLATLPVAAGAGTAHQDFAFFHENVMGTSMELRVRAASGAAARRAEGRALAEIDRLAATLSNHDPASEFRRWQATAGTPERVSPVLLGLLREADAWRERTGGAFDARAQAFSAAWSRAAAAGRPPTVAERRAAAASLARSGWRLDHDAGTAIRLGDAPLSLDAIAKGAIVERACRAALEADVAVSGVVMNVGGDLHALGDLAATVGIVPPWADSESAEPLARITVRDRSLATSGRSQRGYQIGDRRYSHVIDPRTGEPATSVLAATVLATDGAASDALATALNVLEPEQGLRLVEATPGAACLIVTSDRRVHKSASWPEGPGPAAPASAAAVALAATATAPASHWSDDHELAVSFEINQPPPGEGRYRRPYVAIWVEDENGLPVRNLLLWVSQGGSGPFQWLPDLKRWYRADQLRKKTDKTDMVLTMPRPTRPPGKYAVAWDGKDGQGRPVPPGTYTLFIDAAREHGTYQGMRQSVVVGGEPFSVDLVGNVEIRGATVSYRRKSPAK